MSDCQTPKTSGLSPSCCGFDTASFFFPFFFFCQRDLLCCTLPVLMGLVSAKCAPQLWMELVCWELLAVLRAVWEYIRNCKKKKTTEFKSRPGNSCSRPLRVPSQILRAIRPVCMFRVRLHCPTTVNVDSCHRHWCCRLTTTSCGLQSLSADTLTCIWVGTWVLSVHGWHLLVLCSSPSEIRSCGRLVQCRRAARSWLYLQAERQFSVYWLNLPKTHWRYLHGKQRQTLWPFPPPIFKDAWFWMEVFKSKMHSTSWAWGYMAWQESHSTTLWPICYDPHIFWPRTFHGKFLLWPTICHDQDAVWLSRMIHSVYTKGCRWSSPLTRSETSGTSGSSNLRVQTWNGATAPWGSIHELPTPSLSITSITWAVLLATNQCIHTCAFFTLKNCTSSAQFPHHVSTYRPS